MQNTAYYKQFQPGDVDKLRAAQFDELIEELSPSMQARAIVTMRIFQDAGFAITAAKSMCISLWRYDCLSDEERYNARMVGMAHNSLAPSEWRMKK